MEQEKGRLLILRLTKSSLRTSGPSGGVVEVLRREGFRFGDAFERCVGKVCRTQRDWPDVNDRPRLPSGDSNRAGRCSRVATAPNAGERSVIGVGVGGHATTANLPMAHDGRRYCPPSPVAAVGPSTLTTSTVTEPPRRTTRSRSTQANPGGTGTCVHHESCAGTPSEASRWARCPASFPGTLWCCPRPPSHASSQLLPPHDPRRRHELSKNRA